MAVWYSGYAHKLWNPNLGSNLFLDTPELGDLERGTFHWVCSISQSDAGGTCSYKAIPNIEWDFLRRKPLAWCLAYDKQPANTVIVNNIIVDFYYLLINNKIVHLLCSLHGLVKLTHKLAITQTSLVVQWLRLHSQCRGLSSVPGWGTRSHMPQLKDPTGCSEDPAQPNK